MDASEFLDLLKQTGAVQSGHFLLSSGRHSPQYVQCALLLQHPDLAGRVCAALAARFAADRPDVVVGPAYGGMIVAYETARALGTRALFAERVDGRFILRRSFRIEPGERVLITEDVVTTGASTLEVAAVVGSHGGIVIGAGALVDRSAGASPFPWRLAALARIDVPAFLPADCPQCAQGVPLVKPGSRALSTARP